MYFCIPLARTPTSKQIYKTGEVERFYNLTLNSVVQCFSTAGQRPGTGPWHQLYRAAKSFPGICHFGFLSIFHE